MKIGRSVFARFAAVFVGAALLFLASSLPAQAASYWRMNVFSNYVGVGADRHWVEVCDMEADGVGVSGTFYFRSGSPVKVGDGNGSAAGCGNRTFSGTVIGVEACWNGADIVCDYRSVPS
ncbi:hypothetical protein ACIF80_10660 [Streptomyces sp. NPDC085927]|uniref:hypothetical protein n=1 Tax=Streptomyces sp. NPDC085927 TaxID=3365738 RepID=UPI0037CCD76D